jgi:hypothetical protein
MLRSLALAVVALLAAPSVLVMGGDADKQPVTAASSDQARQEAEAMVADASKAMREADADPHRAVDAALGFSHALKAYQDLGDVDAVCEMQANIYWCKKRMNLDNLQEYVAKKGTVAQADLTRLVEVADRQVPVEEAQAYYQRALKYQSAHPDKHFEIAVRFFEVRERFPGTEWSKQAETASAKEQSAFLAQMAEERKKEQAEHQKETDLLKQEREGLRTSRFMRPASAATGTTALPDKGTQDKALATLKKLYKDDYLKRKDAQKRRFAKKLFDEGAKSKDDAGIYYEMLDESVRLATESEDYEQLLTSIEKMGETFTGFDATGYKRTVLGRIKSKATAGAILKLMDDAKDKAANTTAGKFFCLNIGHWEEGLPMLTLGGDADLAKVAEMELGPPKNAQEQMATGDAWYEIGKKAPSDKTGMWSRAQFWYVKAQPDLTGVNKARVEKTLDEIDKVLPPIIADYNNITPKQWDKIKGQTMVVEARLDRGDTGISLTPGKKYRVVAHPTDKWTVAPWGEKMTCDFRGVDPRSQMVFFGGGGGSNGARMGALVCTIGNGPPILPGVIEGSGHLWIMASTNNWGSTGGSTGTIRVKIMSVVDDE